MRKPNYIPLVASDVQCARQDVLPSHLLFKVIEHLPVSVAVFDRQLRFMAASDRFFENSPLQKSHVRLHAYWYDLVPDMPQKWKDIHQRCLKGEQIRNNEDPFCRQDGTVEWWKWEVAPWYEAPHQVGGIILYAENITALKRREKNLRQKLQRLNQSNTDLSEFAHACAHDLHAPLRTMSNYLQLMNAKFPKEAETLQDYYHVVMHAADYMKNLIYRILHYTDVNNDQMSKSWFEMEDVLTAVLTSLRSEIEARKAQVIWRDLPRLYADQTLIGQVMQNLIMNALNYNESSIPRIEISVRDTADAWIISFQDNGVGIKKIHATKIFEAYQRIKPGNKMGTGIGLYRCKRIINDHGGKIWVTPLEHGSVFHFTLPKDVDEETW